MADTPGSSKTQVLPLNGEMQELFAEDVFRRMLCLERKRAERSERSFLLMLVNVEGALLANGHGETLAKVASALFCSKRETDVAGWYRGATVLGVIFAEIDDGGAASRQGLIGARVTAALRATLDAKLVDRIQISFHVFPDDWKQGDPRPWQDSELYPDLLEREDARKVPLSIKRVVDIVGSATALVVGAPVMIAIAIAIKLTSKGPILFKQERVGWRGSRFVFLKFRSMKCANDPSIHQDYVRRFIAGMAEAAQASKNSDGVYKIQDDPRVTRVGRFLRKTSLDELPQFINVLRGEMSLVGPRPPIPYELEHYRLWHRRRVLEAKPGITGLWQVNGRSRLKFDDMVRLDLRYAGTWSLWSDLKVLLQTPRAALFCRGAY